MNKFVAVFAIVLVLVSTLSTGDALKCYECEGCGTVNGDTSTCEGKNCYEIEMMSQSNGWDRGCTGDIEYCVPHIGMPHGCKVCSSELCNGTPY